METPSGVYKITNKVNNKVYIGCSEHIGKRVSAHRRLLRNNTHYNKHLQNAWNKYKEESFNFEVIEYCSKDELSRVEHYWVRHFDCDNSDLGYNLGLTSEHSKFGGKSKETRHKMAESAKGRKWSNVDKLRLYETWRLNGLRIAGKRKKGLKVTVKGVVEEYESIIDFCKKYRLRYSSVIRSLKNKTFYQGIYKMEYK